MTKLKSFLCLISALCLLASFKTPERALNSIGASINFIENAPADAFKKAKAEHKLIFVDAYAIWCGPCKQLKKTTFRDSRVADFFNTNFINLSMDMEKGEGVAFAEKWAVNEFPTLLILDSNGKLIARSNGLLNATQLIDLGKRSLKLKQ